MTSFTNRSVHIISLMLLGLFLGACSGGDTGRAGDDGGTGPVGPPGPPGPSTGSGVPIGSADRLFIAVTGVDVPPGGGAPTVSVSVTNDLGQGLTGLSAGDTSFVIAQLSPGSDGGSSEWQSYVTRTDGGVADVQASTETAIDARFVDNGDGTYEYTFASALTAYPAGPVYDEMKTHRVALEVRNGLPNASNGVFDFMPLTGGASSFERKIVDNDTCFACHDRIEFHGRAPGPRTDVDFCVTCHNPSSIDGNTGNSVDMKVLMHNIHSGRDGYVIQGFGPVPHDYSDVKWTQDVRNCQTCHEESDGNTPQASNWQLVPNRAACGTCHFDDGIADNNIHDYAIEDGVHPFGLGFDDDLQCLLCHGPDSDIAEGSVRVAVAHEIPTQIESQRFQYNIESVTGMAVGTAPTVEFSVTNPLDGSYYDIPNVSEFTTCARGASRLAIGVAWNTADYTNTGSGAPAAQPMSMNPLACFGNPPAARVAGTPPGVHIFSVTGSALPPDAVGTAAVTIDGHPAVDIEGTVERIPVTNVIEYVPIGTATLSERREVIDIVKCDDCHKELSLHGNNRTDNPEVCVTCHNPNATDVTKRVAIDPMDLEDPPVDCLNVLGPDDVAIDFKVMIHAIHASGEDDVPAYEVCGYNNSVHVFDIAYPGHVNNCEGCHIPGTYFPVDPSKVLGTTVDAGDNWSSPLDDQVVSPNTAVCSTCHTSSLAAQHMIQNGGDFDAMKMMDGTLSSSGVETCELCHGPGRTADVKEMHGVDDFQFN